jgi:ABC-type uncharacterized transport system substrate-binding protein
MGNSTDALEANLVASFRDGLRELGYEEERNIAIKYVWADGKYERFPTLVTELITAKVDVIVTAGTPAALAVKQASDGCRGRSRRHWSCNEFGPTGRKSHRSKLGRARP